jgi:septum formation protein
MKSYSLILGSTSPRRKELLRHVGIPFKVVAPDVDESLGPKDPIKQAVFLACEKGRSVMDKLSARKDFGKTFFPVVVGADTLVARKSKVYGKPLNANHARKMLKELGGHWHTVVTAVFIGICDNKTGVIHERIFCVTSDVEFAPLTKDILDNYIATKEPLDKAGSYGIQGPALTFIRNVRGSYSNVVGFPLEEFIDHLKASLGQSRDTSGKWRRLFKKRG